MNALQDRRIPIERVRPLEADSGAQRGAKELHAFASRLSAGLDVFFIRRDLFVVNTLFATAAVHLD